MSGKRLNAADPTAAAAVGQVGDNWTAEEMRRRARIREAADARRNEAIAARRAARAREA